MAKWSDQSIETELPRLLAERRRSLRSVAKQAKVDPGHLSRALRRKDYKSPSGELARKVALALDLDPGYFPEARAAAVIQAVRDDPGLRDRVYRQLARRKE